MLGMAARTAQRVSCVLSTMLEQAGSSQELRGSSILGRTKLQPGALGAQLEHAVVHQAILVQLV